MFCPSAVTEKALASPMETAVWSRFSSKVIARLSPVVEVLTSALSTSGGVVSAATVAVAALVSVSALPASSVKLTLTLMVVPRSASTRV